MTKILWAVDPFQDSAASLRREAALIRRWFSGVSDPSVEPVFVLSPAVASMPIRVFTEWAESLRAESSKLLQGLMRGISFPGLKAPRILTEEADHTENLAAALLDHAKKERAELIVLGAHAKSGVRRLFVGSFAETLLLRSSVDLLVINPGFAAPGGKNRNPRILFPTDLSEGSRAYFERVLRFAAANEARLELLHAVRGHGGPLSKILGKNKADLIADANERRMQIETFAEAAKSGGIEARSKVVPTDSASASILEAARRTRPELIAIAAKGSASKAEGLGASSITRQVIRQSTCPVWVLHDTVDA